MTQLQIKLTKVKGGFLAQSLDNPAIIVSGKNKTEVKSKLKEGINGYVFAFPETKGNFFTGHKMYDIKFIEIHRS